MALLAYNLTGSPVTLTGTTVVLSASASPPSPGPAYDVTAELQGLSGPEYTALEAQRPNTVRYVWSGQPEYATGTLTTDSVSGAVADVAGGFQNAVDGSAQHPIIRSTHRAYTVTDLVTTYSFPSGELTGVNNRFGLTSSNPASIVMLAGQVGTDRVYAGPWRVNSGAWTRPAWFANGQHASGKVFLASRSNNSAYVCTNTYGQDIIGTHELTFSAVTMPNTVPAEASVGQVSAEMAAVWFRNGFQFGNQGPGSLTSAGFEDSRGGFGHLQAAGGLFQLSGGPHLSCAFGLDNNLKVSTYRGEPGFVSRVLRKTGATWANSYLMPSIAGFAAIHGVSATDIWAGGATNGLIYHWDGSSWTSFSIGFLAPYALTSIWMVGASDGWAVIDDGKIFHWDGVSWTLSASPASVVFTSVWGASSTDVWAVGYSPVGGTPAKVYHWDGFSWSDVTPGVITGPNLLRGVHGTSATDVWIVSGTGGLYHWDGAVWTLKTTYPAGYKIYAYDASNVFAAVTISASPTTTRGVVHSSDGGATWVTSTLSSPLNGVPSYVPSALGGGPAGLFYVDISGVVQRLSALPDTWVTESIPSDIKTLRFNLVSRFGGLNSVWGATSTDVWIVGPPGSANAASGSLAVGNLSINNTGVFWEPANPAFLGGDAVVGSAVTADGGPGGSSAISGRNAAKGGIYRAKGGKGGNSTNAGALPADGEDAFFEGGDGGTSTTGQPSNGGKCRMRGGLAQNGGVNGEVEVGVENSSKTTLGAAGKPLIATPPIQVVVGADLASAATISPVSAVHKVTGTNNISTINLPYTGFVGSLRFIPVDAFTWDALGNIALGGTAVVGRVVEFTYNGTSWYPSYA